MAAAWTTARDARHGGGQRVGVEDRGGDALGLGRRRRGPGDVERAHRLAGGDQAADDMARR